MNAVLDGKMTFYVGDEVLEANQGSFVFAPSGIPHTFTVDIEPTRVVFASPASFERFALELGQPAASDVPPPDLAVPSPDVLGPVAERLGSRSSAHLIALPSRRSSSGRVLAHARGARVLTDHPQLSRLPA